MEKTKTQEAAKILRQNLQTKPVEPAVPATPPVDPAAPATAPAPAPVDPNKPNV